MDIFKSLGRSVSLLLFRGMMGPRVILFLTFPEHEEREILVSFYIALAVPEEPHSHQYLTFVCFCFKTVLLMMQFRLTSNLKSSCLGLQSVGIAHRQEQPCLPCLLAGRYLVGDGQRVLLSGDQRIKLVFTILGVVHFQIFVSRYRVVSCLMLGLCQVWDLKIRFLTQHSPFTLIFHFAG